jgi:hypothetical protein
LLPVFREAGFLSVFMLFYIPADSSPAVWLVSLFPDVINSIVLLFPGVMEGVFPIDFVLSKMQNVINSAGFVFARLMQADSTLIEDVCWMFSMGWPFGVHDL